MRRTTPRSSPSTSPSGLVKVFESRAGRVPIIVATHSDRLLDILEDPVGALRITRFSAASGVRVERLDRTLLATITC